MSIERILQLKLAVDTGEINAKLDGTSGKLGQLGTQIAGFAKAAGIGLALEGVDMAVGAIGDGITRSAELEREAANLQRTLENLGSDVPLEEVLERVASRARDLGFDEREAVQALNTIGNTAGSLEDALIGLEAAFDLTRANPDEVADLADAGTRLRDVFSGDFTASVDDFGASLKQLERGNVAEAFADIGTAAEDFAETTAGMQARIGETIGQGFGELGDVATELAQEILPVLIDDVLPALGDAWAEIQPTVQGVLEALGGIVGSAAELWEALEPLREALEPVVELFGETFIASLESIDQLLDGLAKLISGDLSGALDSFAEAARTFFDPVVNAVRDGLNELIRLWNGLGIPALSIDIPEIVIFEGFGRRDTVGPFTIGLWDRIAVPQIPKLGTGGIVTGPTLAMLGELGRPEAVIPLDQGPLGNVSVTLNVSGDPAVIQAAVQDALARYVGRNGAAQLDPFRTRTIGARG